MASDRGHANAFVRRDKVLIHAMAFIHKGGAMTDDFNSFTALHTLKDADASVGASVRQALLNSHFTPIGYSGANDAKLALARAMGLKSTGTLYTFAKTAPIDWANGMIELKPWRHIRGSEFAPFTEDYRAGREAILVSFDSVDSKIGAALKDCIARCL